MYIFDFDGVLVNSVNVKTEAFAEMYRTFGDDVVKKVVDHHLLNGGISRYEKFRYYHSDILGIPTSNNKIKELSIQFSKLVVRKVIEAEEIEGVSELLQHCAKEKIVCAINSATPLKELKYVIYQRGWGLCFQHVFGSPPTKISNMMSIIEAAGKSMEESIFFGDAINDYAAAKEIGIDFVGINYSSVLKKNILCFKNFSDFLRLFSPI